MFAAAVPSLESPMLQAKLVKQTSERSLSNGEPEKLQELSLAALSWEWRMKESHKDHGAEIASTTTLVTWSAKFQPIWV